MLRWAMLSLFATAMVAAAPAMGADTLVTPQVRQPARTQLPAGLPRAHYRYKTTLTYGAPPPPPRVYVARDPDLLFTPDISYMPDIPYAPLVVRRPILPGSSALPGYYGSDSTLDYQGPYYGGSGTVSYWNRLPYACGVYGYC
jgi:hypothetical protein